MHNPQQLFQLHGELESFLPSLERLQGAPTETTPLIDSCIKQLVPALLHLKVELEASGNEDFESGKADDVWDTARPPGHRPTLRRCRRMPTIESCKSQPSDLVYDVIFSGPSYPYIAGDHSIPDFSTKKEPRALVLPDFSSDDLPSAKRKSRRWRTAQFIPVTPPPLCHSPAGFSVPTEMTSSDNALYIHPERTFRMGWDIASLIMIIFIGIVVPVELSFYFEDDAVYPLQITVFNNLVDAFFWLDIVFNFFTAFYSGPNGVLVNDMQSMAAHYIRGWFFLDAFASFPWKHLFALISIGSNGAGSKASELVKVFKYTKAVRMIKVLRILKLGELMQEVEEKMVAAHSLTVCFQLAKMCVTLFIMCHNMACAFFFLGKHVAYSEVSGNWMEAEGLEDASRVAQYTAALYFAITTGTTVGYGDISPTNNLERALASVGLVMAVACIGQFINRASTIINSVREKEQSLSIVKRNVLLFMIKRGVGRELQFKVLRYIIATLESDAITDMDQQLKHSLSESLESELALTMTGNVFRQFPLFADADDSILRSLCKVGITKRAGVGDIVVWEDHAAHEMFWIVRGELTVTRRAEFLFTLREMDWFGELALFFPHAVRTATVRCTTTCELLALRYDHFQEAMQAFPSLQAQYWRLVEELMAGEPSGLGLGCSFCGTDSHLTRECPHRRPLSA